MKNNRGFVVSAVLYPLLILFLSLIMGLISMSSTRKNILDNMKMEISESIFDSVTCNCEEINKTLKLYNEKFISINGDITSINGDITSLNTAINNIRAEITNIKNNYTTKTTTQALAARVTVLESALAQLTTKVNTLAQQELTIYMSASGNDSNDGLSSSKPMKTLNAVLNKYSNNSLFIRMSDGTYNWGDLTINNRNITIQADSYTTGDTKCGDSNCKSKIVPLSSMIFNNSYISLKGIYMSIESNVKFQFNNSTAYMDMVYFDDAKNYQYERHMTFELNNSYLNANRFDVDASSAGTITAKHNSSVILKNASIWNNSYQVFDSAHILQATENSNIAVENVSLSLTNSKHYVARVKTGGRINGTYTSKTGTIQESGNITLKKAS